MANNRAQSLRIIGGKWRGRRLKFPVVKAIRPTPDRLRETLFNWLQFTISGKSCLDLFSGSGALGLEALSRGATKVIFVEQNKIASQSINQHLALLDSSLGSVFCGEAKQFLNRCDEVFGVVFLDPPFYKNTQSDAKLLETCIELLIKKKLVDKTSFIFIETERTDLNLPLNILKTAKSGQSVIYLTQI